MMTRAVSMREIVSALPDENIVVYTATGALREDATEIRAQTVNWQSYFQSQMITEEDYRFITAFDKVDASAGAAILKENRTQCAKTFLNLLEHVSKDETLQYVLVMIDDMIQEDRNRVQIFREYSLKKGDPVCGQFLNLLNSSDSFIVNMAAQIIAKIACWGSERIGSSDLRFFLNWLKDQLVMTNNEYMQAVCRCLQMMLRVEEYRNAFISVNGISTILSVLFGGVNYQIQYQLIFCIWILTFNPKLAERLNNVIPILASILCESDKEKVTRITLAVFRNLIQKPDDSSVCKEHCITMLQSKVLKQLSILEKRRFDDEDIVEDVKFLNEKLQALVQELSSFDEFEIEVKSGRLEWSPVHRSVMFWRENAGRLNEKNYELIRILINLLETSRDTQVLSVACYDVGEYVRHYPRGKRVIEQLGGKLLVMQLLSHEDPTVSREALITVQKLMVHNWEYLARQVEKDQSTTTTKPASETGDPTVSKP